MLKDLKSKLTDVGVQELGRVGASDAMSSFKTSARAYEEWLRATIGPAFVEADLDKKHEKMRDSAFSFLRATYWRWAETILEICPEFASAPVILAIGDTHLENFGTWRDAEGRLIWGANDFDDADIMPYPLDLVRLAASALLARSAGDPSADDICDAILDGYRAGLNSPRPVVLDRDHKRLRELVLLPEEERARFWDKHGSFAPEDVPEPYEAMLRAALPIDHADLAMAPRSAGTGSLGRPRFVARCEWQGGPILREAKRIVVSAWSLHHAPESTAIHTGKIAAGRCRAPDPHYRVLDKIVLRRLSPNSRKLEAEDADAALHAGFVLKLMGREIANCQAGDETRISAIQSHLERLNGGWLRKASKTAADAVRSEYAKLD